jgi:hypothetical protein
MLAELRVVPVQRTAVLAGPQSFDDQARGQFEIVEGRDDGGGDPYAGDTASSSRPIT